MPWTTKLLVIANRTVDSPQLRDALAGRAAQGKVTITLVAPATPDAEGSAAGRAATAERLERALAQIRELGIEVDGVVGDSDPIVAVQDIWDPRRFDEVVVATLPTATSRWLTFDLPHRVERLTGARVTHVIAAAS